MKKTIILICFLIGFQIFYAQNKEQKWVIGVGMNAVDFYPTNEPTIITGNKNGFGNEMFNVNDHWNQFGFPKIHVTRHLWERFAFDAAFTFNNITQMGDNVIPKITYHAIDGSVQFSILKNNQKVYPYLFAGGGYTWIDKKGAGTFNSGFGITIWIIENFGINGHAMYKYSPPEYPNVLQHFNYSMSLVYRIGGGKRRLKCAY